MIVLVVIAVRHAAQASDHAFVVTGCHHLGLGNAGVELQFVGRIEACHMAESTISLLTVALQSLQLPHQEPLTGFLLTAFLMLDDLSKVRDGITIALHTQTIVSHRIVPVFLGPIVHGVAALLDDDVLGIVQPPQLHIALGLPGTGNAQNGGLRLIEARHIGEGGSSLLEFSLLELRLA